MKLSLLLPPPATDPAPLLPLTLVARDEAAPPPPNTFEYAELDATLDAPDTSLALGVIYMLPPPTLRAGCGSRHAVNGTCMPLEDEEAVDARREEDGVIPRASLLGLDVAADGVASGCLTCARKLLPGVTRGVAAARAGVWDRTLTAGVAAPP